MLSLNWVVTDVPFSKGLKCLIKSELKCVEWTTISIMLAFQCNFCFGIVLGDPRGVSHQKYVLCGHTCPGGHIMKNQGYSVLTIYTGKLEIQVGKSNGPHHFIWEASENMGCD